ncbi:MAG TPA: ABC transporter permease, partial [Gammaproteobacteria bacterium]|nr:ABC transporter permease [Gammaproteobacteria bacterium]
MSLTANRNYELKTIFAFLKTRKEAMSSIAVFSVLGIALGVAVLITVMSVMNGFQSEIKNRMLGVIPHASIIGSQKSIHNWDALQTVLIDNKEIKSFSTSVSSEALILSSKDLAGIQIKGIDPEESGLSDKLNNIMTYGKIGTLSAGGFNIVIGNGLAADLDLSIGDSATVVISNTLISAIGSIPRLKKFNVSGIFDAGIQEFDQNLAFVNLFDAQNLLQRHGEILDIDIDFFDPNLSRQTIRNIAIEAGGGFLVSDWTAQNPNFFRSLELTKTIIFMVLILILAVASFNIVSTLVMLIRQKRGSIAVLRSLGVDHGGIIRIFLSIGFLLGFLGSV